MHLSHYTYVEANLGVQFMPGLVLLNDCISHRDFKSSILRAFTHDIDLARTFGACRA